MASAMDVDDDEVELPTSSSSKGEKKRFEVKKVRSNVFDKVKFLNIPIYYFTPVSLGAF